MSCKTEQQSYPIERTKEIFVGRDNILFYGRSKNKDTNLPNDLSSYSFRGEIKASKNIEATVICDIQFDNDLANGIIKAFLDESDMNAVLAAVGINKRVYGDIVRTDADDFDLQYIELVCVVKQVTTGSSGYSGYSGA